MRVPSPSTLLEAFTGPADAQPGRTPSSATRPVRLGVVDPGYSSGMPRITFDGETTLSVKGYPWLASYTPTGGDRVALMPQGRGYIILGLVALSTAVAGPTSSGDYEFAAGDGPIMRSPNGTRWRLGVDNAGATVWSPL